MAPSFKILLIFLLPLAAAGQDLEARITSAGTLAGQSARRAYEALLPHARAANKPELLARVLGNLARWHIRNGGHKAALPLLSELKALPGSQAKAEELSAEIFIIVGEFEAAARSYERALRIHQQAGATAATIGTWNRMSAAQALAGNLAGALASAESAIGLAQSNLAQFKEADDRATGALWNARLAKASVLARLGRDEDAMALLRQLAANESKLKPADRLALLLQLGIAYQRLGDPVKAQDTLLRGALIADSAGLPDARIAALKALANVEASDLANLHLARDRLTKYQALADFSGRRLDSAHARLWLAELEFRDGLDDRAERTWKQAERLARASPSPEVQWRVLYGLARVAERRADIPLALKLLEQAAAVMDTSQTLPAGPPMETGLLPARRDVYDSAIGLLLASTEGDVADRLLHLTERARLLHPSPVTVAKLQKRLPSDAALLIYWMGPVQLGCLWITPESTGHTVLPIGGEEKAKMRQFISEVAKPGSVNFDSLAAELGELFLNIPLEGRKRLILVPDGLLASIPFEALTTGGQLVLEKYEVSYLASSSLLPASAAGRRAALPWDQQSLWIRGPAGKPVDLLPHDAHWTTAPGLSAQYAPYLKGRSTQAGTNALHAVSTPVLHLAVHAAAGDGGAVRSRMLVDGSPPSYAYLPELAKENLAAVDLAVLPSEGDGLGFGHALLTGGARTAVTTMWRTSQDAADELLKQFYFLLGEGMPKGAALREAKRKLAASNSAWSHPAHWAGFMLMGDSVSPLPPVRSWTNLLLAAGAVVFAAGLAVSLIVPR